MSSHFQRGELLYDQDRYEQAAAEFQAHLAEEPNDAFAHCLMAMSLAFLKRYDDGLSHAREAIGLAPEMGFAHFALGRVELQRSRYEAAAAAIEEAIRCEPETAVFYGLVAIIRVRQCRWAEALDSANDGLALDPEELNCLNMRAIALRNLGDSHAAAESVQDALARDPNNAFTHANQGWALLETGHAAQALDHFREALRLSPDLEFARLGILEALKAQHWFYRHTLRLLIWLGKKGFGGLIVVVVVMLVVFTALDRMTALAPPLVLVVFPLKMAFMLAAIAVWFAQPVTNLTLLFHPLGRLALSSDQKWQGVLAGLCAVVYTTLFLLPWFGIGGVGQIDAYIVAAFFTLAALSIHDSQPGWPRWACIGLLLAGPLVAFLPRLTFLVLPPSLAETFSLSGRYFTFWLMGLLLGVIWLTDKLEDAEVAE